MGHDDGGIAETEGTRVWAASGFDEDILLAVASDLPVLISGPASAAREIGYELDRQSGSARGAIEVIDCRRRGAVEALAYLSRSSSAGFAHERPRILLVEEVHALDEWGQSFLSAQLEHARLRDPPLVRIVSSSSVPLFDLVQHHAFDERLFYRLNAIHLIVPGDVVWH